MRPEASTKVGWRENFAWLATVGIGFWFLVGSPFGNQNESYYWVSFFEHHSFWDAVWSHTLAATVRPLGQGLAYVGWRVSGGSSWPVQLFNFIVAALALRTIALRLEQTATFAATMALTGATFFSGFIYLFHLHGIFYSPALILLAALLSLDESDVPNISRRELTAIVCAFAVGLLFHPYALILFFAYMAGLALEKWRDSSLAKQGLRIALVALAAFAVVASRPPGYATLPSASLRGSFQGLFSSYQLVEVIPPLSVLSAALAFATLLSIDKIGFKLRLAVVSAAAICAIGFAFIGLPIIMVWIATAIFKMAYLRKWPLTSMTVASALLPGIAPSGSPTYTIYAVVLSVIGLTWGCSATERALTRVDRRWIPATVLVAVAVAGALRMGVRLPVVSRLAQPLLAEREKTKQLEVVIDWMLASPYRDWNLKLGSIANPVDSAIDVINRSQRPPTYQSYLDSYLASRRNSPNDPQSLVVTFGGVSLKGMTPVYVIEGKFAGRATVSK